MPPRLLPPWLLLLLVTLMLYLPGTGTLPLMDRDEPRFARATVEMMQRGSVLVPYFNEAYRFDKPPLTYWWMRLHFLLGAHEWTARLHSVIAVWLTAWVICGIGSRLYDRRVGLMSGMVWLTTLQVMIHGRLCVADMPLLLFLTLAARALLELLWLGNQKKWGFWFWVLYGSLGLGFLAKGPLAFLVPVLAVVLARWWGHKPLKWSQLQWPAGLGIALLIIAAWGIPALMVTQGLFWKVGMGEHVVDRGLEVLNGRIFIPVIYYPLTSLLSLFPWIGLAWPVWKYARKQWDSGVVFLLAWLAAPYVIFSLYATQLPHYVMPGFPAAAILVGRWLVSVRERGERTPMFLKGLSAFLVLAGAGIVGLSLMRDLGDVEPMIAWTGLLLVVLGVAGRYAQRLATIPNPALGMIVLLIALGLTVEQLSWTLRQDYATQRIVKSMPALAKDTACLGWEYTEPSLVFYARRPWEFTGSQEKAALFLQKHPDAVITALECEWTLDQWFKSLLKKGGPDQPAKDRRDKVQALQNQFPNLKAQVVSGLNSARLSWVQVKILRQVPESAVN